MSNELQLTRRSPEWEERLLRDIPGAQQLELLPDTGQLVMEEQPAKVTALLAAFLQDTARHTTQR